MVHSLNAVHLVHIVRNSFFLQCIWAIDPLGQNPRSNPMYQYVI